MIECDTNLISLMSLCLGLSIGATVVSWLASRRIRALVTELIELRAEVACRPFTLAKESKQ